MKNKKIIIIVLVIIQLMNMFINIRPAQAQIREGDEIELLRRP